MPEIFITKTYGKWILSGEHAVLRGHTAIIFPVTSKTLELRFEPGGSELLAEFAGEYGQEMQFLFWGALERVEKLLGITQADFLGKFTLINNVPIGTGMGGSAALCVALGRFFVHKGYVQEHDLLEFARQIENLFHQESSGADIAVSLAGQGIRFSRIQGLSYLNPAWHPHWYLSFSGAISSTARCVEKVKQLFSHNLALAESLDLQMAEASEVAMHALKLAAAEGLDYLVKAVKLAHHCFKEWGLIEGPIENHLEKINQAGALAAKPTGSGNGGFVLSLWEHPPKHAIMNELGLISV